MAKVGKGFGKFTGKIAGSLVGRSAGAAVGTFFMPGLGTAIGGFVGGAVGTGLGGAVGGSIGHGMLDVPIQLGGQFLRETGATSILNTDMVDKVSSTILHDALTPTIHTSKAAYTGGSGLRAFMAGEYNFNLMLLAPKWEDLVYMDIQLSKYGIAVNENDIVRLDDPKTKNGLYNYIQVKDTIIKTNVSRAKDQLTMMLKQGTRWWRPDKEIGSFTLNQVSRPVSKSVEVITDDPSVR